jgi:hypothetical protein
MNAETFGVGNTIKRQRITITSNITAIAFVALDRTPTVYCYVPSHIAQIGCRRAIRCISCTIRTGRASSHDIVALRPVIRPRSKAISYAVERLWRWSTERVGGTDDHGAAKRCDCASAVQAQIKTGMA